MLPFLNVWAAWPYILLYYKLLFSQISRARPSPKFPLQFMSIYSNDNIRKIAKLTTRELPHLVQKRENNCTRK